MSRPLDPDALDQPVGHDPDEGSAEGAIAFLEKIEDLLASTRYEWASDTLSGIYATVEDTQRVTDAQRRAVLNIEEAGWR
jgi:hypothetical protein